MTFLSDSHLEEKIIGAILQVPNLMHQANHIDRDAFSDNTNALAWSILVQGSDAGVALTPSSLATAFPAEIAQLGGVRRLEQFQTLGYGIITDFGPAVESLRTLSQWRKINAISARLSAAVEQQEKTPDEILSALMGLSQKLLANGRETARNKRAVARSALARAALKRETITTGITNLDFLMQGGLQDGRLYGIGGLYGRGKTILAGSISDNVNMQGVKHVFISLETDPEDIEIRSCAKHLNANAAAIFDQDSPDHATIMSQVDHYLPALPDNTLYEFAPGASINDIHRMILRAKARHGARGFIVDYWQLIRGKERGQSEEGHLREVVNRLAALCRQEDIWGIVTAQIDERGNLKISDALLQAASLYVRLVREADDSGAYLVTEKSNYTRYGDTGNESVPGMVFDMAAGPHFRDTEPLDIPGLSEQVAKADDLRI